MLYNSKLKHQYILTLQSQMLMCIKLYAWTIIIYCSTQVATLITLYKATAHDTDIIIVHLNKKGQYVQSVITRYNAL